MTTFGKTEVMCPRPRNTNSNRVLGALGAILSSQATLSRLDETLSRLGQEHQVASANKLKPNQSQKPSWKIAQLFQVIPQIKAVIHRQINKAILLQQNLPIRVVIILEVRGAPANRVGRFLPLMGMVYLVEMMEAVKTPIGIEKRSPTRKIRRMMLTRKMLIFTVTLNQLKTKIIHLKCWPRSR